MFMIYQFGEKVELKSFESLDEAHSYCEDADYPILLIFEGMILDDVYYNRFTEPLALYINGKRYDTTKHEG